MVIRLATMGMAGCSGCHIAILDIGVKLLDLLENVEIVYSSVLVDTKNPIPPNIDVALVEGSVRTDHDREMALEMRKQARLVVALGSCSCFGGVNGLANLFGGEQGMEYVYRQTLTMAQKLIPSEDVPHILPDNLRLSDVIKVDFMIPGCPPDPEETAQILQTLISGGTPTLSSKSICDECPRKERITTPPSQLRRSYLPPEPDKCLLAQGFLCMGPATRAGCHAACPSHGVPCTGCRGPSETVWDQGVAMLDALAALAGDGQAGEKLSDLPLPRLAGTFARFTYASSALDKLRGKRKAKKEKEG